MSLSKLAANYKFFSRASSSTLLLSNSASRKSKFQLIKSSLFATKNFNSFSTNKNSSLIIPANSAINPTTQIRYQSKSNNIKLIDKRFKNLNSRENFFSSETSTKASKNFQDVSQKSIFRRFKDAYKQHGKVLIYVHITTCFGWIIGFFALSKTGYDITKILDFFEALHIISHETNTGILDWMKNFNMQRFLLSLHCDYILSEDWIKSLGQQITGDTLKHILTAVILYKIFTPLRYLLTLTLTKIMINLFKTKGIIPKKPPPGHSIQEMYSEKKFIYQKRLANQRERYLKEKQLLKGKLENSKQKMKDTFKN